MKLWKCVVNIRDKLIGYNLQHSELLTMLLEGRIDGTICVGGKVLNSWIRQLRMQGVKGAQRGRD